MSTHTTTPTDDLADRLQHVRSVLCVPAHDDRKAAKARSLGADLVMWDLEDAVPADQKFSALDAACTALSPFDMVRINHPRHGLLGQESEALRQTRARLVMVPKVISPHVLHLVRQAFGPSVGLVACFECPYGVIHISDILADLSHGLVAGLAFGRADFAAQSPPGSSLLLEYAATQVALAAAAFGLHASDGPCYDLTGGTLADAVALSRKQGFISKGVIHPSQVEIVNRGMSPSSGEVETAKRTLAFSRGRAGGAFRLAGSVAAPPTIELANRTVAAAAYAHTTQRQDFLDMVC